MVSNFDRIFAEITRESARIASEHDMPPDVLTELVMEIVDLEDQHSARQTNVTQQVSTRIENVARDRIKAEEQ